jgi:hypothetical protein
MVKVESFLGTNPPISQYHDQNYLKGQSHEIYAHMFLVYCKSIDRYTDKPWTDKPWTQQTLDTTNPGHDKPWT